MLLQRALPAEQDSPFVAGTRSSHGGRQKLYTASWLKTEEELAVPEFAPKTLQESPQGLDDAGWRLRCMALLCLYKHKNDE